MEENQSESKLVDALVSHAHLALSLRRKTVLIHYDENDESVHPSYTRFQIPYNIVCARRYAKKRRQYESQFELEINQLINYMDSGASAVVFGRHVAYTSLWPPLHTREEIKNTEKYFRLSKKQTERLNYLMENKIA